MDPVDFLKKLAELRSEQLDQIKGLGPVLSQNLIDFTSSSRYRSILNKFDDLKKSGKNIEIESSESLLKSKTGELSGQIICITGSFDIPRTELKEKLEAMGAHVTDSVSKKTTILLAGDDAGSKLEKAKNLKIRIVSDLSELQLID